MAVLGAVYGNVAPLDGEDHARIIVGHVSGTGYVLLVEYELLDSVDFRLVFCL